MISEQILDSVFKRDDIRGIWPNQLTTELAFLAGFAFAEFLRRSNDAKTLTVAVGYDARTGSADLAGALCRGLKDGQADCVMLGMVSSEQVCFACGRYPERFDGGVMITASHNPAEYNGMKFVLSGGAPLGGDDLLSLRRSILVNAQNVPALDLSDEFADFMLATSGADKLSAESAPLRVVVAAGNGVGCVAFSKLASRLQATGVFEFIELDGTPDGSFPRGVPNPLVPEYMNRLGEKVRECNAAFGIGFDGDADRAGFVDGNGVEITPSMVYALVASFKLDSAPADCRPLLMRNLCCSRLILDLAEGRADVLDTPVGHGQIKRLMRHPKYASRVIFAGEHSGHYFYPEFFSVDSGMMTSLIVLQLVMKLQGEGKFLTDILADWRSRYVWSGEINFTLPSRDDIFQKMSFVWEAVSAQVPGMVRQEVALDQDLNLYRVFSAEAPYAPAQLKFPDLKGLCEEDGGKSGWWFVVRPSGNEPKLRLNVEAWGENAAQVCAKYTEIIRRMM